MKLLNKCIAGLLALLVIGLCSPRVSFCAGSNLYAKAAKKTITRHEPQMKAAPEKEIVLSKAAKGKKKKSNLMMIGLGVLLIGGLAAGLGGGGGGGNPGGGDTGTVRFNW